jgi:ATP-binding cassette subfamily B protein
MLIGLLSMPIALLRPLPLKVVIDSLVGGGAPIWGDSHPLMLALGVLLGVEALSQLQGLGIWLLQTYTSERLLMRLRSELFFHVQRLSFSYHDTRGTADATYRIHYDAQSIQSLAVNGLVPLATAFATLAAMIVVTARLDWTLALVAGAALPPLFAVIHVSGRRLHRQWTDIAEQESSAMSVVQEVLSSLRVVRAFGREDREQERFVEQSTRTFDGQMALAWTQGMFGGVVGMIIAVALASALGIGTLHVRSGVLGLGSLILIMAYMTQLLAPIETIVRRVGQLQGDLVGAERAFALLDQKPDVVERTHAKALARARGAVSFRRVSFEYDKDHRVLHDISFEVDVGARVGIAGPTGAGKTTLVNLLVRFYDPTEGQVLLDGVDLRAYRIADLRNQFAIVLQEPVLFSASLAQNIEYARPGATFDEIVTAAKAASVHEFISRLPEGYNTPVGERGLRLSGGERQRISLARAFLRDAPILVMDEPTSSVDIGTEATILDAVDRLLQGRTSFTIAHRPETLEACDIKLVLEGGRLVDQGRRQPSLAPSIVGAPSSSSSPLLPIRWGQVQG